MSKVHSMTKDKIRITMFSSADAVAGQGVGSAYEEQVKLIREGASDIFDVEVNKWTAPADIQHFHTIDPTFFIKLANRNAVNVVYCHFLPDTLNGSLKIPKMFNGTASTYITSFYKSADRLVVVNPSFIDELVRYGIKREKIYYIPNYVSREKFHPLSTGDSYEWRMHYGIEPSDFVVLGCGQVQTRKGVQDFVKVARQLPDVRFVWAGGFSFGPMTEGYEELKEIMENPPANVTFTGIVDREDMVHIYNMADMLFMPSYNELFPMTILEAVNLDKPMVLRDLDLYKNILFNQYLKGTDNEEFAALIRKLKEDPEFYAQAQEYSRKIADYYSRENVLKLWIDFYLDAYREKQEKRKETAHEA